jgi:hypothetical protein
LAWYNTGPYAFSILLSKKKPPDKQPEPGVWIPCVIAENSLMRRIPSYELFAVDMTEPGEWIPCVIAENSLMPRIPSYELFAVDMHIWSDMHCLLTATSSQKG